MWGRRPALINPASSPGPGPPVSGSGSASKWMERVCPSSPFRRRCRTAAGLSKISELRLRWNVWALAVNPGTAADQAPRPGPGSAPPVRSVSPGKPPIREMCGGQTGTGQVAQYPAGGLEIYPLAHPAQHLFTSRFQAEKDAIQTAYRPVAGRGQR